MADEYKINGVDIREFLIGPEFLDVNNPNPGVWHDYKVKGSNFDLSSYAKYDPAYHKYNPLVYIKDYFRNGFNKNNDTFDTAESFTSKVLGKGYKPSLTHADKIDLDTPGVSYIIYYSYDNTVHNQFGTGKILVIKKKGETEDTPTARKCSPVIAIEAVGGGGGGGSAKVVSPFVWCDAFGGSSAAYGFLVYDMSWGGTAPTNSNLKKNGLPNDQYYREYNGNYYYKVMEISVGARGAGSYSAQASAFFGGVVDAIINAASSKTGGTGGSTKIKLFKDTAEYEITLGGGGGGSEGSSGTPGAASICDKTDNGYTVVNYLPNLPDAFNVEIPDITSNKILSGNPNHPKIRQNIIWFSLGHNGDRGKENGGTTSTNTKVGGSYVNYDIATPLEREQTTGNVADAGGCTPIGKGGCGSGGPYDRASQGQYGAGGGGGIPWFMLGDGRQGGHGGSGIVYLHMDTTISDEVLYTLRFNTNQGVPAINDKRLAEGEAYGKLPGVDDNGKAEEGQSDIIRDGYDFNGWFSENYTENSVVDESKRANKNTLMKNSDTTLYAYWTKKGLTKITISTDGGSFNGTQSIVIGGNTSTLIENRVYSIYLDEQYWLPNLTLNTVHKTGYNPSYWGIFGADENNNNQSLIPLTTGEDSEVWGIKSDKTLAIYAIYNIHSTSNKINQEEDVVTLNLNGNGYLTLQYFDPSQNKAAVENVLDENGNPKVDEEGNIVTRTVDKRYVDKAFDDISSFNLYAVAGSDRLYYYDNNGTYWELISLGTMREKITDTEIPSLVTVHEGYTDSDGTFVLNPATSFRMNKPFERNHKYDILGGSRFKLENISLNSIGSLVSDLSDVTSSIPNNLGYTWYELLNTSKIEFKKKWEVGYNVDITSKLYIYCDGTNYGLAGIKPNGDTFLITKPSGWCYYSDSNTPSSVEYVAEISESDISTSPFTLIDVDVLTQTEEEAANRDYYLLLNGSTDLSELSYDGETIAKYVSGIVDGEVTSTAYWTIYKSDISASDGYKYTFELAGDAVKVKKIGFDTIDPSQPTSDTDRWCFNVSNTQSVPESIYNWIVAGHTNFLTQGSLSHRDYVVPYVLTAKWGEQIDPSNPPTSEEIISNE